MYVNLPSSILYYSLASIFVTKGRSGQFRGLKPGNRKKRRKMKFCNIIYCGNVSVYR